MRNSKSKNKMRIVATTVIAFIFVAMVAVCAAYSFVGIQLINNPETVGEWFSKLAEGFEQE